MGRGTVMVVDDDRDVRAMLGQLLSLEGYEVVEAGEGGEALRLLAKLPAPDAILLDLRMPGVNGWQFRELQRRDPRLAAIPVMVVSADRKSSLDELRALDAYAYYRKPVDLDRLLEDLARLEGQRSHSPAATDPIMG